MEEDLPKRPREYVLGSDLERHSVGELEALAGELERELDRVRRSIAARNDVRSAAESFFKPAAKSSS
jgi:uncharacterized small protein (DUF1192 family)